MNETINSILNRRSCRVFTEEAVEDSIVQEIVKAGIYAPSSLNKQPWHFTVVENKDIINELSDGTKEILKEFQGGKYKNYGNNEKFHVFYNAPVVIIVSGEEENPYRYVDCAAASENMLVAAESLGIGSCWIGFIHLLFQGGEEKKREYQEKLGLPEGYIPMHALVFGHKKINNQNAPKRRENTVNYLK